MEEVKRKAQASEQLAACCLCCLWGLVFFRARFGVAVWCARIWVRLFALVRVFVCVCFLVFCVCFVCALCALCFFSRVAFCALCSVLIGITGRSETKEKQGIPTVG